MTVVKMVADVNYGLVDMRGAFDELAEAASKGDAALVDTWESVHRRLPILEGLLLYGGLVVHDMYMEWDDETGSNEGYELIESLWREIDERDEQIRDFEQRIRSARDGS